MGLTKQDWSWWSEAKLDILRDYLEAFALASQRASERIYLDLFAGSFENKRRDGEGYFPGSPKIALDVKPAFTRLAFFEKRDKAKALISSIQDTEPNEDVCWKVFSGDCNVTIDKGLNYVAKRWAPAFAFLDPCGLQLKWATLEKLAKWKRNSKTKMELLILFPDPALPRVIGAGYTKKLNDLYGTKGWISIDQLRCNGSLDASSMRIELVNLYRWRLETILEYKKTHAIGIVDNNKSIYTLIFATDHPAGDRIMEHVYKTHSEKIIPMMQAKANITRQINKGQYTLESMSSTDLEPPYSTIKYEHFKPWPPPHIEGEVCIDEVTAISPSLPFSP